MLLLNLLLSQSKSNDAKQFEIVFNFISYAGATSIAEEITVNKILTNFFSQWF